MDTLHTVLRDLRGEAPPRRDHLAVFREFLDHLDRVGKQSRPRQAKGGKRAGRAAAATARAERQDGCPFRSLPGGVRAPPHHSLSNSPHPVSSLARKPTLGSDPRAGLFPRAGRGEGTLMLAPSDFSRPSVRIDADGSVEGYASLFGEVDQARDMVMPGAFAASLKKRGIRRVPMLFQHDPAEPIGIWLDLREDFRGLYARGRLIPDVMRARELLALLKAGASDGLSIGFRTIRGRIDPKTRIRRLTEIDLWEISHRHLSAAPGGARPHRQASPAPLPAACLRAGAQRRVCDAPSARRGAPLRRGLAPWIRSPRWRAGLLPRRRAVVAGGAVHSTDKETDMNIDTHDQLETKAGIPREAAVTHGEMMRAFEAFKESNDERLATIERRGGDVLLEEKLARIDAGTRRAASAASTTSTLKGARPQLGRRQTPARRRIKCASTRRRSRPMCARGESAGLRALETKAMSVGSAPDGGYLVPPEVETRDRHAAASDLADPLHRRRAPDFRQRLQEAVHDNGPGGRLGRRDRRARRRRIRRRSTSCRFRRWSFTPCRRRPRALLEDTAVNIDEWIAAEVEQAFAEQEGAAFVNGDGDNKPKGFLAYDTVAEASWEWGKIGYVATGVDGAFAGQRSRPTC